MEAEQFEKKSDSCCHRDDGARLPVGELQAPKQRESADREAGQEQTVYGVLALEAERHVRPRASLEGLVSSVAGPG